MSDTSEKWYLNKDVEHKHLKRYYYAMPILIEFVKTEVAKGNKEAQKALTEWDKARWG